MSLLNSVEDIHSQVRDRNTLRPWQRKLAQKKDVFSRLAEAHIEHLQATLTEADRSAQRLNACLALAELYVRRADFKAAAQVVADAFAQLTAVFHLQDDDRQQIEQKLQALNLEIVASVKPVSVHASAHSTGNTLLYFR
jgi:hypothetical protein